MSRYQASIAELDLPNSVLKALEDAGIVTIGAILQTTRDALAALPGMSARSAGTVAKVVRKYVSSQGAPVRSVDPDLRPGQDPKSGFILPPDHRSIEFDRALSNLFDVDEREFAEVPIEALNLRARPMNCLASVGCETLDQLLDMTTRDLASIRSMGAGSLADIFEKAQAYMAAAPSSQVYVRQIDLDENPAFRAALESLLEGRDVDTAQLSQEMNALFSDYEKAVEAVGEEICLALYLDPKYGGQIVEVLTQFGIVWARWTQSLRETRALVARIPEEIQKGLLLPFMRAFEAQNGSLAVLEGYLTPDMRVSQLVDLGEEMKKAGEDPRNAKRLNSFAAWLDFSLPGLMDRIVVDLSARSRDRGERLRGILRMRAEGNVLEKTGQAFGITRERVRQILTSAARKFWTTTVMQEHDIVLATYAVLEGPVYLTEEDLVSQIGVLGQFVWTCVRDGAEDARRPYVHVPDLDVISMRLGELGGWSASRIFDAVRRTEARLPERVLDSALEKAVEVATREAGVPGDIGELAAADAYRRTGHLLHKGRLSRLFMYGYILREFFPSGYRIGVDTGEFREHLREVFGDDMSRVVTDHALDAKATEIGILCGRGRHMHPDYLNVDQKTLDLIAEYIRNSPRSVILYSQIFEDLRDQLEGTPITDKYLLQGALKKYGCEYRTCRDFVRKAAGATLADEMESYIEQKGIVSRQELIDAFPALCDATLSQIATKSRNLLHIDDGWYAHVSQFDIRDEDYPPLRAFLLKETEEGPVSAGGAYRKLKERGCALIERNHVPSRRHLYAILRHMFDGEFSFSRPYIARLGAEHVTGRGAILKHLGEREELTIDELLALCKEHGIHYVSIGSLCRLLGPEYLRVNANRIMRADVAGVTPKAMRTVQTEMRAWLEQHGYLTAVRAPDELSLPDIRVPWTDFLVDSVVSLDKDIEAIRAHRSPVEHPNVIYVGGKYEGETFESLLEKVIETRRRNGKLSRKEAMAWLRDQGLIGRSLPASVDAETNWTPSG